MPDAYRIIMLAIIALILVLASLALSLTAVRAYNRAMVAKRRQDVATLITYIELDGQS